MICRVREWTPSHPMRRSPRAAVPSWKVATTLPVLVVSMLSSFLPRSILIPWRSASSARIMPSGTRLMKTLLRPSPANVTSPRRFPLPFHIIPLVTGEPSAMTGPSSPSILSTSTPLLDRESAKPSGVFLASKISASKPARLRNSATAGPAIPHPIIKAFFFCSFIALSFVGILLYQSAFSSETLSAF